MALKRSVLGRLPGNTRLSVKRSVLAQDASFEPRPFRQRNPPNLDNILSLKPTPSQTDVAVKRSVLGRLPGNARFSVKRSVLAQDASFEPRPFRQRNPPNLDNILSLKPTPSQTHMALKRSVLGRLPGNARFSVKRSVLAQDASFEPRPFSQRNPPPPPPI